MTGSKEVFKAIFPVFLIDLNELVNNYILSDFSKYSTKKYYILENEILRQLLGGDDKNE